MNHEVEKRIGKNLRTLREKADMTQDELACALQLRGCDITRSAVAKLEVAQRHLYVDEIILLKEILDTNYDELLA